MHSVACSQVAQNLALQAAIDLLRPNSEKQIQERDAVEKILTPLKAELALLEDSQEKIKAKTDLSKELDGLNAKADEMACYPGRFAHFLSHWLTGVRLIQPFV